MSPKQSSLALVEEEQSLDLMEEGFNPQLNLIDKTRTWNSSPKNTADEVVTIRGRITVSF